MSIKDIALRDMREAGLDVTVFAKHNTMVEFLNNRNEIQGKERIRQVDGRKLRFANA